MSGGFGYYEGDIYDAQQGAAGFDSDGNGSQPVSQQQQRNPLRDHLKKVEDQNGELQKQLASLLAENRQAKITSELQTKGYDPAVASLYGGEPEKLDEWLTKVGPLLAKQPGAPAPEGQSQQQGGTPASTVPAEGQAALQQLQQMGIQGAAPVGTEQEQISAMRNMNSAEELTRYLQSQGNPHFWNG